MANGRIRQSRLPDLIAQFGNVNPGAVVDAGFKGFERGQDIAAKRKRLQLEVEKAKLEMAAKTERERAEKQRQSQIKEFTKLTGRSATDQVSAGQSSATVSGEEVPVTQTKELPSGERVPDTISAGDKQKQLAQSLFPETAIKEFLKTPKPRKPNVVVDPNTKLPVDLQDDGTVEPIPGFAPQPLPPSGKANSFDQVNPVERTRAQQVIDKQRTAVNSDQNINNLIKSRNELRAIKSLVQSGNQAAVAILPLRIIRGVGREVGNLSRSEVLAGGGSQALYTRFQRKKELWLKGQLPPEDVEDFISLSLIAEAQTNDDILSASKRHERIAIKSLPKFDPDFVKDQVSSFVFEDPQEQIPEFATIDQAEKAGLPEKSVLQIGGRFALIDEGGDVIFFKGRSATAPIAGGGSGEFEILSVEDE